MTFEPPPRPRQLRAVDLTNAGTPYLLKGLDEDDSEWNLVRETPICQLMPGPDRKGFLPEVVTVIFADGMVRPFNPNDQVLVGPVTNRVGGDRQEIREVAAANGWDRPPNDSKDLFTRGLFNVEVHYEGDTVETARRIRAGQQIAPAFTGRSAKPAAINWLTSAQPDQA